MLFQHWITQFIAVYQFYQVSLEHHLSSSPWSVYMLFDDVIFHRDVIIQNCRKNNNKLSESAERYMEPEIIKRMVGECSSSVTDGRIFSMQSWE